MVSVAVFDFTDFARGIYSENPEIYLMTMPMRAQANTDIDPKFLNVAALRIAIEEKFLLPALYGGATIYGEASCPFEVLVVLEAPSKDFTKKLWRARCASPEEAIDMHREIFFQWAFKKQTLQAELFRGLVGEPSRADFFRRLYITDVWKDAAFREHRKPSNPAYERYWRSKLQTELSSVATKRVIFVGAEARRYGWDYVRPGIPRDHIPFPTKRNKTFGAELERLLVKIRSEPISEGSSNGRPELRPNEADARVGLAAVSHDWTLNDEINHNKFGILPINEPRILMNLSYQRTRQRKKVPVGSFPLDMSDLLGSGLVCERDKGGKSGFWLRFVHDLANNGIYIQINRGSPSRFVAKVPAGAL